MALLKVSTARNRMILMIDSADHISGKAGLTLTITASKDGAVFASITPTVTDRGSGWYNLALTTAHTDTLGDLAFHITGTSADPNDFTDQVVSELPGSLSAASVQAIWDALTSALTTVGSIGKRLVDNIDATISSRLAGASYTAPDNATISAINAKTTNLPVNPAATTDIPTANQNADALLDRVDAIETGMTPRGALRVAVAGAGGQVSGAGTGTTVLKNPSGTKNRVTATTPDDNGNRTAIVLDLT